MNTTSTCEVLPLSTRNVCVLPHVPTRILGKPMAGPLMLERLVVSNAGTPNGAGDWIVNDIEIDGVSQLAVKDLSGALFSTGGVAAGREPKRSMSKIHFTGIDVIERESEVAVTVTYVGPFPEGVPFYGSIKGPPPQRHGSSPDPDPIEPDTSTREEVLWLGRGLVPDMYRLAPGVRSTIRGTPREGPLMLEHLFITSVGIPGSAGDWIINDVEIDGVSQLSVKDLPGAVFSIRGIGRTGGLGCGMDVASRIHFTGLDVIERGSEVAVTVTYVGPHPEGRSFLGTISGGPPPQRPTVLPIVTRRPTLSVARATIHASLDASLDIERLEIENGCDGADWLVHDIRVDGVSQLVQPGSVRGDMFGTNVATTFVRFQPGRQIEIDIEYIGIEPEGICFGARVLGTVVREDRNQPPPHVHAIVRASNDDPGAPVLEVVARCDWRPLWLRDVPGES